MNALILVTAVLCQWDMQPQSVAASWDMTPVRVVATVAKPVVVDKIPAVTANGYPARGGIAVYVNVNGVARYPGVWHLEEAGHAGKFDAAWLRTLSRDDLLWLHSHDHYDSVDWRYAKKPGQAAAAPKLPIEVTLWTYPGCGPCATLKATLGTGDADFKVTEKVESKPPYTHAAYPVLTAPGRVPLVGVQSKAAVRKWLGLK